MQLFDPTNPNEKKKMIAAAVLGLAAIIVLGYVFLGGSSKSKNSNRAGATPTPTPRIAGGNQPPETPPEDLVLQPIAYPVAVPAVSEADRNIFSYYVAPTPLPKLPPPPSPTPTPPLAITSLSPPSVYALTGDFSLQVMGDRFTPAVQVVVDGRPMPTRFINSQQIATTVTKDQIANPGGRQVMVKNSDGSLYSNYVNLNVTPPPIPNYSYVGFIGKFRANDTAVLQDKNSKDLLNVQRGDLVGGRFRVNSISEKEVVVVDTNLKIRHTITFSSESSNLQSKPPTRRTAVDDEP